MKLKLKENPREWQKFAAVLCVFPAALAIVAVRQGRMPRWALVYVAIVIVAVLLASLVWPRAFRPIYRTGMTISFHIGQVMGRILLTVFFLLILTPIGWLLRLCGKDLLRLKKESAEGTYWRPVKPGDDFDRMF
ncbi:MAG: hypothetical protein HYR88_09225 [Verrucomicrobia bacterium]|nr:hypothetical protein [Verrucomicrobiota bacterium]MBI3870537.1 hypothetical protein [Verrucomicrobiota bacterium]